MQQFIAEDGAAALYVFTHLQLAGADAGARLQAAAHQQLAGHAHIAMHDQRAGEDEVVGFQVIELQHGVGAAKVLQQPACIVHATGGHLRIHRGLVVTTTQVVAHEPAVTHGAGVFAA